MSSNINDIFDKVYCINLKRRVDRWEQVSREFEKYNIKVERFGAIDGRTIINKVPKSPLPIGHIGCVLSHLSVLKHCNDHGYNNILIFEDDVKFNDIFPTIFKKCHDELPDDYDMFYLGGGYSPAWPRPAGSIVPYSDSLSLCVNVLTGTGYSVNKKSIKKVIKIIEDDGLINPIDVIYSQRIQPAKKSYMCNPRLLIQAPGYSDIVNGFRDYANMK
jgi:GR25 family glycosyltransferase involved in LPS biosynthesis